MQRQADEYGGGRNERCKRREMGMRRRRRRRRRRWWWWWWWNRQHLLRRSYATREPPRRIQEQSEEVREEGGASAGGKTVKCTSRTSTAALDETTARRAARGPTLEPMRSRWKEPFVLSVEQVPPCGSPREDGHRGERSTPEAKRRTSDEGGQQRAARTTFPRKEETWPRRQSTKQRSGLEGENDRVSPEPGCSLSCSRVV